MKYVFFIHCEKKHFTFMGIRVGQGVLGLGVREIYPGEVNLRKVLKDKHSYRGKFVTWN